jgi:hypothetical protein
MRRLRIYAPPDGDSHFDEANIPMTATAIFPDTAPFEVSASYPVSIIRISITRIPARMR